MGYCGGKEAYPTYEAIKDHTEAVQVEFDPEKIKYEDVIRRVLDDLTLADVLDPPAPMAPPAPTAPSLNA